jgi:hypothetical protein
MNCWSNNWRRWRNAGAVLAVLGLSGCLTINGTETIVIDSACEVFGPISYSASQDTPETVIQIRRHNARYLALCKNT